MESLRLPSKYQALSVFEWAGIPRFAVIAGANGVGKTQLLELLAADLGALDRFALRPSLEINPRPVAGGYLPANWRLDKEQVTHEFFKPVTALMQVIEDTLNRPVELEELLRFAVNRFGMMAKPHEEARARRVFAKLKASGKLKPPISRSDILETLDSYDLVTRNSSQPLATLAEIFYSYVNARVTRILRGDPIGQLEERIGKPPWEKANRLLQLFETRFRLTYPDDLRFPYEPRCILAADDAVISPGGLSSGEQAILALVALAVTTKVLGAVPPVRAETSAAGQRPEGLEAAEDNVAAEEDDDDATARDGSSQKGPARGGELLLLDEPDAHLHTSMVKRYLDHLVELTQQGVQIIMVTHRPDTIALAPEESLFEMRRDDGQTSIVRLASRAELISRLAADTIAVLPGVRVVLVEDDDDRGFHQRAYDRARKLGQLSSSPPRLVFMPVNARGGGGKDAVKQRLEALQAEGLGAVHRGLIDGDNETGPLPAGVFRLERYALESYLADPIALYWAVVSSRSIDDDLGFSREGGVGLGDLDTLRSENADTLQRIADLVCSRLERAPTLADRGRRLVILYGKAGAVSLEYPQWLFKATKKDLRTAIGQLSPAVLGADHFHDGPERSGLVPEDLVEVYCRLASALT